MGTSLRLASSLSFLGIAMLAARVGLSHSLGMTFLAWNLGLAWTAFYLVVLTARLIEDRWVVSALGVGLVAWLFFPNTIYLVSDLAHANPRFADPMTYVARCHFKAKNFKAACDAAREYAKRGAPETQASQLIASVCK